METTSRTRACFNCSDLGRSPFRKASARADVREDAPGPPRGSQGVLMWVIKSFAIIHLEQQPCLTWGVMTAPQIERWPGRLLVGHIPRTWGRHRQAHPCYGVFLLPLTCQALCLSCSGSVWPFRAQMQGLLLPVNQLYSSRTPSLIPLFSLITP